MDIHNTYNQLSKNVSIQDEVQPLLPIAIASLPSAQKKFDWADTYIHTYIHVGLGYICGPSLSQEINEL